ncbi:MAG TPA: YkvA family protein [Pyrinomonadaceae bacterium]|jgi:uncharacterized membrane protein YkvA (DUF1232 family)
MSEIEPVKTKSKKPTRKEKVQLKSRMSNLMTFLPNLVRLLGRLLTDGAVPTAEKALFAAAIIYVIVPLDFIPDVFPFIGQVDDIYLVALTLLRLINRSDESIVRRHWSGGGDIVGLADSIAGIAPMLLPKRVSRVLSAEVELADAGKALQNITKKRKAVVAEIPLEEETPKIRS